MFSSRFGFTLEQAIEAVTFASDNTLQINLDATIGDNEAAHKVRLIDSILRRMMKTNDFDGEDVNLMTMFLSEAIEAYKATEWLPLPEKKASESAARAFARIMVEAAEEVDTDSE